jgi:hypothetical protein
MAEKRKGYKLLVEKPKETRPLGRPRRRLVDNIKLDLEEIGLVEDRDKCRPVVNAVMKLRVP